MLKYLFSEVAVWVDESNSVPSGNVLNQDVPEECGFSRARLADDVKVVALVFRQNAERGHRSPGLAFSKMYESVAHGFGASFDSARRHVASCRVGVLPSPADKR